MDGRKPRVFLSHNSKDKPFVRELYRRLTRDGVSCFLDEESIEWGANWVRALEKGIDECEYIVFVLSPDFCSSKWVELERTSSIANDPEMIDRKARPLMLRSCRDLKTFPRFLRQVQSWDVSSPEKFEAQYAKICRDLGGFPSQVNAAPARSALPPPKPLPTPHRMPHRSMGDKFIGRVAPFWALHDTLFRDGTAVVEGAAAVSGTGGLGKTQLAIEYAHRMGNAYSGGVFWVDADQGISTLITQISSTAGIEIEGKAEEGQQLEQIWRALSQWDRPVLIVLDNLPERGPVKPYLPVGGKIHALITTRRQDLNCGLVRLEILSKEEGVRLLNSGVRQLNTAEAAELAQHLGGLPLALELARGFLNQRSVTISKLLIDMRKAGELELLAEFASEYQDQLPSGHASDIVGTFQLSWDAASDTAKKVWRAMGELAPVAVPRFLLRDASGMEGDSGSARDPFEKAIDELVRLSVVEVDTAGNPIAHRLILAFARHRNRTDAVPTFDACLAAVQKQMDLADIVEDSSTIRDLEQVSPHAENLLQAKLIMPEAFGKLADRLGVHQACLGRYLEAKRLLAAALASDEKIYEAGDPSITARQSNLGIVLKDLGELAEAQYLLRQALASAKKTYKAGHPSIASSQSNLASVLEEVGESTEARDLLQEALASDENTFRAGHPTIAIRQSNLALVLHGLGESVAALSLLRKALQSDEATY